MSPGLQTFATMRGDLPCPAIGVMMARRGMIATGLLIPNRTNVIEPPRLRPATRLATIGVSERRGVADGSGKPGVQMRPLRRDRSAAVLPRPTTDRFAGRGPARVVRGPWIRTEPHRDNRSVLTGRKTKPAGNPTGGANVGGNDRPTRTWPTTRRNPFLRMTVADIPRGGTLTDSPATPLAHSCRILRREMFQPSGPAIRDDETACEVPGRPPRMIPAQPPRRRIGRGDRMMAADIPASGKPAGHPAKPPVQRCLNLRRVRFHPNGPGWGGRFQSLRRLRCS